MAEIVDFGLQQHKIKMDSRYFENVLSVVAGDTGRRLEVQLLDTNGMVQDTTGLNLRLNAEIAGKATFTDATLVDAATGKYQLDLSNGMFLAPGNWQFQWLITDSAGKKLHSFAFTGNIGKNISEGGSQATNFYLNLEDLKKMQDDLLNGTIDSSILETTITEKLTDLETQYAPKLTEVTAQLEQTKTEVTAQLAQTPTKYETGWASFNTFNEETRATILGMETGQINAVLGEGNVKKENLDDELRASLFLSGDLSNKNIIENISDYSFDGNGNLYVNQPATERYRWVLFDIKTEIEYTLSENVINTDSWLALGKGVNGEVLAMKIFAEVSMETGHTRFFTQTARTEILDGDENITPALVPGDRINVVRSGWTYVFTVKRKNETMYAPLITFTIPTQFTEGFTPSFGFLSPKATTGVVAYAISSPEAIPVVQVVEKIVEEYKQETNIVDLIMFMGQSNMAGRGTANEAPIVPNGQGFEFRAITDATKLYPIAEPFGKNENNPTSGVTETTKTGSMVSSFVIEYYKRTKTPVVGVSCSKGGTSINFWQPGGAPLNDAISRFHKAETWLENNDYKIRHKYMVWCQGETDGDNAMPISEYQTKLEAMVNAMVVEGIEKCFLVRIGNHRDNATIYNPIIQAQTEVAKENKRVVMVSTKFDKMASEGLMKDFFHYKQSGYNETGADAGKNTAYYVNTGKEPTMYDWENQELYFSHK